MKQPFALLIILIFCQGISNSLPVILSFQDTEDITYTDVEIAANKIALYNGEVLKVWNLESNEFLFAYYPPQPQLFYITSVAISPDGSLIAVGSFQQELIVLLNAESGSVVKELDFSDIEPVESTNEPWRKRAEGLEFYSDGHYLFSVAIYSGFFYYDLETGERTQLRGIHSGTDVSIEVSKDENKIILNSFTASNKVFSYPDGEILFQVDSGPFSFTGNTHVIRYTQFVGIVGNDDNKFQIIDYDIQTNKIIQDNRTFSAYSFQLFSSKGKIIITGAKDNTSSVLFIDGNSGTVIDTIQRNSIKPISATTFSSDNKLLVVYSNEVVIYDISDLTSHISNAEEYF